MAPGLASGNAAPDLGGRFLLERLVQPEYATGGGTLQVLWPVGPAPFQPGGQHRSEAGIEPAARAVGDDEVRQLEERGPCPPGGQAQQAVGADQQGDGDRLTELSTQLMQGIDGV
ncbi:hypothetical protein FQZ97_1124420 [compost metagenome]